MDSRSLSFLIFLIFFSNNVTSLKSLLKQSSIPLNQSQNNNNITLANPKNKSINAVCFINKNSIVYDLFPLQNNERDFKVSFNSNEDLLLNFCGSSQDVCNGTKSLINYRLNNVSKCISLGGKSAKYSNYNFIYNQSLNHTILVSNLSFGDRCLSDKNKYYQTNYEFICDDTLITPVIKTESFNINKCENTIQIISPHSCPQRYNYGLWNAIMRNVYTIAANFIVIGLFLTFLAKKFYRTTEILTGIILSVFLILFTVISNLSIMITDWQLNLALYGSVFFGILCGYFIMKVRWLTPTIYGGTSGFIIGKFLYHIFFSGLNANPGFVFWATLVIFAFFGCLVGYNYNLHIVIGSFSMTGSFLVIRGLSLVLGYFPDERQLSDLIGRREFNQVQMMSTWHIYLYFLSCLALTSIGCFLQVRLFCTEDEIFTKQIAFDDDYHLNKFHRV